MGADERDEGRGAGQRQGSEVTPVVASSLYFYPPLIRSSPALTDSDRGLLQGGLPVCRPHRHAARPLRPVLQDPGAQVREGPCLWCVDAEAGGEGWAERGWRDLACGGWKHGGQGWAHSAMNMVLVHDMFIQMPLGSWSSALDLMQYFISYYCC